MNDEKKSKRVTSEKPVKIPLPFFDAVKALLGVKPEDMKKAEEEEKKKTSK